MKDFKITRNRNSSGEYFLNEGELLYFFNTTIPGITQDRKLSTLRKALEHPVDKIYIAGTFDSSLRIVEG